MKRCSRCGFLDEPRIPVGDEDGLCLWCRLALEGVSLAAFYESGDWQNESDWRGYEPSPEEILREQVQATRKKRSHTVAEVARQIGVEPSYLSSVLSGSRKPYGKLRDGLVAYVE